MSVVRSAVAAVAFVVELDDCFVTSLLARLTRVVACDVGFVECSDVARLTRVVACVVGFVECSDVARLDASLALLAAVVVSAVGRDEWRDVASEEPWVSSLEARLTLLELLLAEVELSVDASLTSVVSAPVG